jgi:transcription elongation factor GreA
MTQQPGSVTHPPAQPNDVTYLTKEAYERLANELETLKTEGREEASKAISAAREHGDIRENADYDAAKNEQGMMEARIRQLETTLRTAVVTEKQDTSVASPGTVVTLDIDGERETYFLGSREEAIDGLDVLSLQSPLGQAVTGKRPGEKFTYATPTGVELPVKLISIGERG